MALRLCQEFTKTLSLRAVTECSMKPILIQTRNRMGPPIKTLIGYDQPELPKPSGAFWRKVLYPEKYTVEPLNVQRLGGRDPVSGKNTVQAKLERLVYPN